MNTYTDRIEIRAHREPWLCDTISLRVANIKTSPDGRTVALAEPIVMTVKKDEELCCEQPATMQLRPSEAQQFMDELWRVGIRPTEGAGSVGQIAATEKHLEDMRRLVFSSNTAVRHAEDGL
jgi:hypothetical protein